MTEVTANIFPSLTYDDAPAAIEWLCTAFGFTRRLVVPDDDGGVRHSELSLGGGVVMVGSPRPADARLARGSLPGTNVTLSVFVEDPDAHHDRAVAAGAEVVMPLTDEEYGARGYLCRDPEGNHWYFSTYVPGQWWEGAPSCSEA